MKRLSQIVNDFIGLRRICGARVALRWLSAIVMHSRHILRAANLQSADVALGPGPFAIRLPTARETFRIAGDGVISGVREIYVRDCYLRGGALAIRPEDTVLDLGANIGVFTSMALAHGAEVIAVEPSARFNAVLASSIDLNPGHADRIRLIRAFVGDMGDLQSALEADREEYRGAPCMSERQLIQLAGLERVDFLKCDIEGSEFSLLKADSSLLRMTHALAIEVHSFAGDVEQFVETMRAAGFSIVHRTDAIDGSCVLLASRA